MSEVGAPPQGPVVAMPVTVAAELQDSLLVVMRDLERLEGLVTHAANNLLDRFSQAAAALGDVQNHATDGTESAQALAVAHDALKGAVTELQFQDMSSQLIWHTTKILQGCAFRLAAETMGQDEDEISAPYQEMVPDRPNPVTQSEMDAGSIELF
jgi:hypothetical protein